MESDYEECAPSVGTHSFRCIEVDGDCVDSMSANIKLCCDVVTSRWLNRPRIRNPYLSPELKDKIPGVLLLQLEGVLSLRSGVISLCRIMTRVIPYVEK